MGRICASCGEEFPNKGFTRHYRYCSKPEEEKWAIKRLQKLSNRLRKEHYSGIENRLSTDDLLSLVEQAGITRDQVGGHSPDSYVLSRIDHDGHYEIGNVIYDTVSNNTKDVHSRGAINREQATRTRMKNIAAGLHKKPEYSDEERERRRQRIIASNKRRAKK